MPIVPPPLYVYVDESGDFNFKPNGSRYYVITALATFCPNERDAELTQLRQDILAGNLKLNLDPKYLKKNLSKKFHATEDKQVIRDLVFREICQMRYCRAYSIVIQKNILNPDLYEPARFYPKFMGVILKQIFEAYTFPKINIYVSGIPVNKHQAAFKMAVTQQIENCVVKAPYSISYPSADSICMLQVVDYINWAIYRKWERKDSRSYCLIEKLMGTPELEASQLGDGINYPY